MTNKSKASVGNQPATFADLLTIMLIGLKLTDNIDLPWWWVLSPLWLSILIAALLQVIHDRINVN